MAFVGNEERSCKCTLYGRGLKVAKLSADSPRPKTAALMKKNAESPCIESEAMDARHFSAQGVTTKAFEIILAEGLVLLYRSISFILLRDIELMPTHWHFVAPEPIRKM